MPPVNSETSVLIVDSDDGMRGEIVGTLRTLGYRVFDYSSGDAAVDFVRDHAGPLALLLTISVKGAFSDIQLAAAIRLMRPRLPVLHMSTWSRESVIAAADSTVALTLSA